MTNQVLTTSRRISIFNTTHLDIFFVVNNVCQFMHSSCIDYQVIVKRILQYLKNTSDYGLQFTLTTNYALHAFSDPKWAASLDNRRSIGGYAIYLGINLVFQYFNKQRTISHSSTKVKYKALTNTASEITWIKSLLIELGVLSNKPPTLKYDNVKATYLIVNLVFHTCTEHVEIDFHFVHKKVVCQQLIIQFISTQHSLANV